MQRDESVAKVMEDLLVHQAPSPATIANGSALLQVPTELAKSNAQQSGGSADHVVAVTPKRRRRWDDRGQS